MEGGEWLASLSDRFIPVERAPGVALKYLKTTSSRIFLIHHSELSVHSTVYNICSWGNFVK